MPRGISQPSPYTVQFLSLVIGRRYDVSLAGKSLGTLVYLEGEGWRWRPAGKQRHVKRARGTALEALKTAFRIAEARGIARQIEELEPKSQVQREPVTLAREPISPALLRIIPQLQALAQAEPATIAGRLVLRLGERTFAVEGVPHTMTAPQAALFLARLSNEKEEK